MKASLALAFLFAAGITACRLSPQKPYAMPAGGEMPTAQAAAAIAQGTAAQAASDATLRERDSRVAASIREAHTQNEGNPEGAPKSATRAELELADRTLGVEPTPADQRAAAERARAKLEGRIEESARLYSEASSTADRLNRDLAQARAERDAALSSASRAIEESRRQIEANTRDNQRKLDAAAKSLADLRAQMADENRQRLVRWLTIAAVALFVAGVAIAALTQGRSLVTAAWFGGGGVAAAAAARVIGHWLFPWCAWGAAALGAVGFGWWLLTEVRTRRALGAMERDRALLEETAAHVVGEIDRAKSAGSEVVSLDLSALGRSMDRRHKEAIEQIRAQVKRRAMNFPRQV